MKTKEALDRAVERIGRSTEPMEELDEILDELMYNLPVGKVKSYFQDLAEILTPLENIDFDDADSAQFNEALEPLRLRETSLKMPLLKFQKNS